MLLGAVHERGDVIGEHPLGGTRRGPLGRLPLQFLDLLAAAEREHPEQARDLGIAPVDPELVERVRAHQVRAEPDRIALGLPVFGPVRLGDQWRGQRVHGVAGHPPDQVNA